MKKQALMALALAGLAGTAMAAPRETQNFAGPLSTHAPVANAANTQTTFNFALTGYRPIGVRVQADLTSINAATYASEATVQLTDPSGQVFVISLAPTVVDVYGSITGSQGFFSFPVAYTPVAGTWTARFYDAFNDAAGAEESSVANFSISMDDGVGTTPSLAGTFNPVDGVASTLNGTVAPDSVTWYRLNLGTAATVASRRYLDINTTTSGAGTVLVMYNANGGYAGAFDFDSGVGLGSFLSYGYGLGTGSGDVGNGGAPIPSRGVNGELAAGTYYIGVLSDDVNAIEGGFLLGLFNLTPLTPAPGTDFALTVATGPSPIPPIPTNESLGTISADRTANYTPTSSTEIKWYSFTTPEVSRANNRYLDIHTNTSVMVDTEIGIYANDGSLVVSDDDDGVLNKTLLSFGVGSGQALGDGAGLTDGVDGNLAAGTYYMAVGNYNVTYGRGFVVTSDGDDAGDVTINFLAGTRVITVTPPTNAQDIGTFAGPATPSESVDSFTTSSASNLHWFTFNATSDVSNASGLYLDIDSEGTVAFGDTVFGLYNAASGTVRSVDDDDASGLLSALSYGLVGPRAAIGTGAARNGRDGTLTAGQYYLGVMPYVFGFTVGSNFNMAGGVAIGDVAVNFRSNMDLTGGGGGSSPCGPADVAGSGAAPGSDNNLDNNDFILFIQLFFANDPAADIAGGGAAPGSDGAWDNNDFILFIQNFFDGGAASGCNGNP